MSRVRSVWNDTVCFGERVLLGRPACVTVAPLRPSSGGSDGFSIRRRQLLRRSGAVWAGVAGGVRNLSLAILCTATLQPQSAQPAVPEFDPVKLADADEVITDAIAEKKLPGAVLWFEHQGRVYTKAFGHRAVVPQAELMTEDTIFDAASLTKIIATAPAIMLLHERGRLDIDAQVQKYLPEFRNEGMSNVTVRHLLTHTSGLRPGLSRRTPWSGYDAAIRLAFQEKLTQAAGATFVYSDINFILLGEIVRRVSKVPLNEFVSSEIYSPLRMYYTGFLPPARELNRIAPTEKDEEGVILRGTVHDPTARRMGGVAGHAGIFTTAADLARYARMILNAGELEGARIFQPATVKLMTSVQSPKNVLTRRGLGWDIDSAYSRPRGKWFPLGSFGHTGWTGTCFWIDPFSKTFWIFLSNRVHPDGTGNVLQLYTSLGTLAAEAVRDFDFSNVAGSLLPKTNALPVTNSSTIATTTQIQAPPRSAEPVSARFPLVNDALRATNTSIGRTASADSNSTPAALVVEQAVVLNGIDVLVKEKFGPLKRLRLGLITNHTGQDRRRNPTIDLLYNAPDVHLQALFSPEHGIRGELDQSNINDSVDAKTGVPIYSLYPRIPKRTPEQSVADYDTMALSLRAPKDEHLAGLDALVFDIQDIGCRFYTYSSTLGTCLEAAGRAGLRFFVLDRPNPINGLQIEGPVHTAHASFVAYHSVPLRHGLTVGELARMYNVERGFKADLAVIAMEGWRRALWFDQTGLGWANPSPNMRSLNAATLYPGIGLLESAISVGRGTDRPFEIIGAPYIDDLALAAALNRAGLSGLSFVPIRFVPAASTFSNQPCGGVSIIITDREACRAVDAGLEIARTLFRFYPKDFAIDKMRTLLRHEPTLDAIKAGRPLAEMKKDWEPELEKYRRRREAYLIYR